MPQDAPTAGPSRPEAKKVLYCGGASSFPPSAGLPLDDFSLTCSFRLGLLVCGFPPEYCEFNSSISKCKTWAEKKHPDLYARLYSEGASPPYLTSDVSCHTRARPSLLTGSTHQMRSRRRWAR